MKVELTEAGCTLYREDGDKRISHESTVGYHMKLLLNAKGFKFVRTNPSEHGLTSCTLGLWDKKRDIFLWHERYQIEDAAQTFNHKRKVFFLRT